MSTSAPLSLFEKLHLTFSVLRTLLSIPYALFTFSFMPKPNPSIPRATIHGLASNSNYNSDSNDSIATKSPTSPSTNPTATTSSASIPAALANHLAVTAIRTFASTVTIRELQSLSSPTITTYTTFMKSINRDPVITPLAGPPDFDGNTAALCWLQEPSIGAQTGASVSASAPLSSPIKSSRVILFLHGGAYVAPASPGHFRFLWDIVLASAVKCGSAGKQNSAEEKESTDIAAPHGGKTTITTTTTAMKPGLAVAVLAYTLAPDGAFPTQLNQAAAALRYLFEDMHLTPSQLVLVGDSAGGNLALALLGHCAWPCRVVLGVGRKFGDGGGGGEEEERGVGAEKKHGFGGVVLISPWVAGLRKWEGLMVEERGRNEPSSSWRRNAAFDCLSAEALDTCAATFRGDMSEERQREVMEYVEPLTAGQKWWEGVFNRCLLGGKGGILMTAGANEVFADDIMALGLKLSEANQANARRRKSGKVELDVRLYPGEVHDEAILDYILERKALSGSTLDVRSWLMDLA